MHMSGQSWVVEDAFERGDAAAWRFASYISPCRQHLCAPISVSGRIHSQLACAEQ